MGQRLKFPNYDVFKSLKTVLTLSKKSTEAVEMQLMGLTVSKSTGLGASGMQRVKLYEREVIEQLCRCHTTKFQQKYGSLCP